MTDLNNKELTETKERIKTLMKLLKEKENEIDIEKIKEEFKELISKVNPLVIALAENELVNEGFSREELMNACDIHLLLFKDKIENPDLKLPADHPISRFQEDHRIILKIMEKMLEEIKKLKESSDNSIIEEHIQKITNYLNKLMEAENHNVRQENTLFPILEKHGIEQPPAIMWAEHTQMKEQKKQMLKLLKEREMLSFDDFYNHLKLLATNLLEKFTLHTQKEQNILYVTALEVISEKEWKEIKEECDNLGYFEE